MKPLTTTNVLAKQQNNNIFSEDLENAIHRKVQNKVMMDNSVCRKNVDGVVPNKTGEESNGNETKSEKSTLIEKELVQSMAVKRCEINSSNDELEKDLLRDGAKERNADDIEIISIECFPISKDEVKSASIENEVKVKEPEFHLRKQEDIDPVMRCKVRSSQVLSKLGNTDKNSNENPENLPSASTTSVFYGGYLTKLISEDELKAFKLTNQTDKVKNTKEKRRRRRKTTSPSEQLQERRSRSRSHGRREKPESRHHSRARSKPKKSGKVIEDIGISSQNNEKKRKSLHKEKKKKLKSKLKRKYRSPSSRSNHRVKLEEDSCNSGVDRDKKKKSKKHTKSRRHSVISSPENKINRNCNDSTNTEDEDWQKLKIQWENKLKSKIKC